MPTNIQEIYQKIILPLEEAERLKLIELIARDISRSLAAKSDNRKPDSIRKFFGMFNTGDPDSANNEKIDADLAREYASTHDEGKS
jgi:hypothetical protein